MRLRRELVVVRIFVAVNSKHACYFQTQKGLKGKEMLSEVHWYITYHSTFLKRIVCMTSWCHQDGDVQRSSSAQCGEASQMNCYTTALNYNQQ